MNVGFVGLGRMGANMARRLARAGHGIVAWNRTFATAGRLAAEEKGIAAARSLEELVERLSPPRTVWIMVPAGEATDEVIDGLASRLAPRDTLIDGGNSNFRDTIRRSERLSGRGIDFLDVGTSGGTWGLSEGYCLMIGGDPGVVERHRPFFESLAPSPDTGWGHVGPVGAGHFAKMVHNGIEYGLMQAYAEGFDLLAGNGEFSFDLHRIAEIWRHGSVVRSWLLDLTASILERNPTLDGIAPRVEDSGEGRWMVAEAIDAGVPVPVIALALFLRFQTRHDAGSAAKLVAALRKEFGGHDVQST